MKTNRNPDIYRVVIRNNRTGKIMTQEVFALTAEKAKYWGEAAAALKNADEHDLSWSLSTVSIISTQREEVSNNAEF